MTPEPITLVESKRLIALEAIIDGAKDTFRSVALALVEIRDQKLYRADYSTFAEYCEARHGWAKSYGYNVAKAGDVLKSLPESLSTIVESESEARELSKVEPEHREEVITKAAAKAASESRPLTARDVKEAAVEVCPPAASTEPAPKEPFASHAQEALGNLKASRVMKSAIAWVRLYYPQAQERRWAIPFIVEALQSELNES